MQQNPAKQPEVIQPQQRQQQPANQLQLISTNINALEPRFNEIVSSYESMITFKKEAHFALQALQKNDFLMSTAIRNPNSLSNAVLNIASIGLSLNPAERQAYLVPRDGSVCLDISYIGFADLATESGSLKFVKAALVYENDLFELNGLGREPTHSFKPFDKNRGSCVGVYCVGVTADNQYLTEWMTIEECHGIRNRTPGWKKSQSGPWLTDEGEMMKKTVIKRAAKLWPKAPTQSRLNEAIRVVNEHEGIDFDQEREEQRAAEKEARRLEIEESQAKRKAEAEEKDAMIVHITELCKIICREMTLEEKGTFTLEVLGVSKFNELRTHNNEALKELINKLNVMAGGSEENGSTDQT